MTATISGSVNTRGILKFDKPLSLQEVFSRAGGFTPEADLSSIIINTTEGKRVLNLIENPYLATTFKIKDHYSIYIPSKTRLITVMGQVKKPGSFPYKPDIRLFDALARAGFITDRADLTQIVINRDSPHKKKLKIKIDRADLYNLNIDDTSNPVLKPGDIIYIPEKPYPDFEHLLSLIPFLNSLKNLLGVN